MKPGPPLKENFKPQGAEDKSTEPCFMLIKSKPLWAVALMKDLDFTLESFSLPVSSNGLEPRCASKNVPVFGGPSYCGAPSTPVQGEAVLSYPSFPQEAFSGCQPWAPIVPAAREAKTKDMASVPELFTVQEGEGYRCGRGHTEACTEHSGSAVGSCG